MLIRKQINKLFLPEIYIGQKKNTTMFSIIEQAKETILD